MSSSGSGGKKENKVGSGASSAPLHQQETIDTTTGSEAQSSSHSPSKNVPQQDQKIPGRGNEEVKESSSSSGAGIAPKVSGPGSSEDRPRQVIAVSASKGPAAFFNLARKFLVTDEMCDLSALEGAIISAVDAAHLLERSKLATIVKIETAYVSVEPKKKKGGDDAGVNTELPSGTPTKPPTHPGGNTPHQKRGGGNRELRRARIIITVKRTEGYKKWLEENPLQAMIAGDGDVAIEIPHDDALTTK